MGIERINFTGHSGASLAARLDMPDGPHLATALFAHCFTCSKDISAAKRISARLAGMGIAVMRFDFTGLGHSDGEFENTTFTSNVDDLLLAAEHLESLGMAPTLLIGHSLGGAAILKAAPRIKSAKAVVTIGAPFDPAHVTHNFKDALSDIQSKGVGEVVLGGRPIRIGRDFVEDIAAENLVDSIRNLKKSLLILHAPLDETVSIENAAQIFQHAKHPKSFVTLCHSDHLISRPDDAEYVATVIAGWASRDLELRPPAPPIGAPEGVVRVTEADPDGFLQDINSGPRHHIQADEPLAYGGTNRGMSPYGLLASGLGACTSMTIRMYARRKKWPLTRVWVDVTHNAMHAQDAGGPSKIDRFNREIHLEGDLDEAQRQRLLEIADKCPVHKTLESGAEIKTVLAD
ncbi:bifunctional alpha/beta hydrolase/OsmC family protein [Litoreibacter janthinus]|uniref:Putative redox protein n=1 Tax=Litoreibacter janthinus TaxID=670154 RepID=A0A1I6H189_9RHOB|nr:bifunctional alpha/beta hydrolase/OsmC family protein [Litoreibacter janthinus]SFR48184.1 putative redox protein [Litoreibacter janthinus]